MDLFGGILDFVGSVASQIGYVIEYIVSLIVQVANIIWQILQAVVAAIAKVLGKVGGFFHHLWDIGFKQIVRDIWHGLKTAYEYIESHVKKIIATLQKIRTHLDRYYKVYLGPILRTIQRTRQFLLILRLLHVQFAAKLDAVLAQVQTDINRAFLQVRGVLNLAIDLLNVLADPTMLLRRPVLVLSVRRTFTALIRQVTGLPPAFFWPSRKAGAARGLGFLPLNFNPALTEHNPPASYYLGLDTGVPSLAGFDPTADIPNSAVDGMAPLDYFLSSADQGDMLGDWRLLYRALVASQVAT